MVRLRPAAQRAASAAVSAQPGARVDLPALAPANPAAALLPAAPAGAQRGALRHCGEGLLVAVVPTGLALPCRQRAATAAAPAAPAALAASGRRASPAGCWGCGPGGRRRLLSPLAAMQELLGAPWGPAHKRTAWVCAAGAAVIPIEPKPPLLPPMLACNSAC